MQSDSTKNSNILLLNFPFSQSQSRSKPYITTLIEKLGQKGYFFHLFSSDKNLVKHFQDNNFKSYKLWAGIEPINQKNSFLFLISLPLTKIVLSSILLYYRLFKKTKILLCLSLTEKISITPIAGLLGYKIFWLENNFIDQILHPKNPWRFFYSKWSSLATIIASSQSIKEQLMPIVSKKSSLKIIHPGLDLKKFSIEQIQPQSEQYKTQFVIGTITRLKKESGLGYLLKSFAETLEVIPNLHLIIIGEGPEKQRLIWLAKQLGIEQRVRFIGWQDDLTRWINNFDLYILPSLVKESFSTVLLQVMALGKPIIATKTGANPEIVEHGKTGIVIEPQNPEMMAQVIINLFNNHEWLEQYGINARRRIEQFFDLEKVADEYDHLFRRSLVI